MVAAISEFCADVGVAIKTPAFNRLTLKAKEFLVHNSSEMQEVPEGRLFLFLCTDWDKAGDPDLVELYRSLSGLPSEDYLIRAAFSSNPTTRLGNSGVWQDNPWKLGIHYQVALEWEDRD